MRKFHYSLERVLRLRQAETAQRERTLARAHQVLVDAESQCEATMLTIGDARRRPVATTSPQRYFRHRECYLSALRYQHVRETQAVAEASASVEHCREALHEAMRDEHKLTRHREKEQQHWREQFNRWEQKIQDEVASLRAAPARA